ncbi:MAG: hypothetical protein U9O96_06015 [Candidatus Thermoplasmatota archaeon]|nr:hypothetical protein [Candidatus Thermoplasmatota archaeon]
MNNREIYVSFITPELEREYEKLKEGKTEDKNLYRLIGRAINDLKKDLGCGIKIPKRLWPKKICQGIQNKQFMEI